ncbi:MAG: hypothetical protein HWD62_00390 [Cyclobacteriaceae bacterium]|nr:MAG: hypothetical protein HWD62_00390 [Cyclobacteriaceae bacterium]
MHLQVDEEITVSAVDGQTMEGRYRRYFPNGKISIEGNFKNGVRWGTFYEYHPNGTLIRKIDYEDGMRHGSVEVYDEHGRHIQRAFYQNNKLVDSIKSYFPSGLIKQEGIFVKVNPMGW